MTDKVVPEYLGYWRLGLNPLKHQVVLALSTDPAGPSLIEDIMSADDLLGMSEVMQDHVVDALKKKMIGTLFSFNQLRQRAEGPAQATEKEMWEAKAIIPTPYPPNYGDPEVSGVVWGTPTQVPDDGERRNHDGS